MSNHPWCQIVLHSNVSALSMVRSSRAKRWVPTVFIDPTIVPLFDSTIDRHVWFHIPPSHKRLSTSITFAALNKFRREISRARRMRFTTRRWRILSYATTILSAALLLHYQVRARIWRHLQLCWPTAKMHQPNHVQLPYDMWNCMYEIVSFRFSRLPVGEEQDHRLRQDEKECDE